MSESSEDEYNRYPTDEYNGYPTDEYNGYPSEDDFSDYQNNIIYPEDKYKLEISELQKENEQLKDEIDNLFLDYQKLKIKYDNVNKIKVD